MQYDLIALDLDGTALLPGNRISPEVRAAVLWARSRGVRVVISTGRICGEAAEFAQKMGTDDEMVTSGGAAISSASKQVCLWRRSIPWALACRAAAAVERFGLSPMVYIGERLYITPYDEIEFGKYKTNEGFLSSKKVVPSVAETVARERLDVDKIFTRSASPEMLIFTRKMLQTVEGVRVMSSADDNLEIIHPQADKGHALGLLCEHFGTTLDHCIAIGDSENDIEMLQAVGMPVAMGNAKQEIKDICRHVTDTCERDGAAKAIYHILG